MLSHALKPFWPLATSIIRNSLSHDAKMENSLLSFFLICWTLMYCVQLVLFTPTITYTVPMQKNKNMHTYLLQSPGQHV